MANKECFNFSCLTMVGAVLFIMLKVNGERNVNLGGGYLASTQFLSKMFTIFPGSMRQKIWKICSITSREFISFSCTERFYDKITTLSVTMYFTVLNSLTWMY